MSERESDDWVDFLLRLIIAVVVLVAMLGIATCGKQIGDLQRRIATLEQERR